MSDKKIKLGDPDANAARQRYPWIVKWDRMMGSYGYYTDNQCLKAVADNAPETAIYKREDGTWATIDGITNETTRHALGLPPLGSKTD